MTGDDRIKARIAGRKFAREVLSLGEDNQPSPEFTIAYWRKIHDEAQLALNRLDADLEKPRPNIVVPMGDAEAHVFGKRLLPFGKNKDRCVWTVLQDEPHYLDWLVRATEEDTFKADLRRYLARKDVADMIPDDDGRILF
jgi:hypothetical protein